MTFKVKEVICCTPIRCSLHWKMHKLHGGSSSLTTYNELHVYVAIGRHNSYTFPGQDLNPLNPQRPLLLVFSWWVKFRNKCWRFSWWNQFVFIIVTFQLQIVRQSTAIGGSERLQLSFHDDSQRTPHLEMKSIHGLKEDLDHTRVTPLR